MVKKIMRDPLFLAQKSVDATDYSLIKEHAYKDIRRSVPGLSFTSPDDKFVKPRF